VARALREAKCELIYPTDVPEDAETNVANVILVIVPAGQQPGEVSSVAKRRAEETWQSLCDRTWEIARKRLRLKEDEEPFERSLWDHQVTGAIEFYSAWLPLADRSKYRERRVELMRLLDGRKQLRDFTQNIVRPGLPKSSLDGRRESLVHRKGDAARRRLWIRGNEQLGAIDLVKRLGTLSNDQDFVPYPSLNRVACDPWIRGLEDRDAASLQKLCELCEPLVASGQHPDRPLHRVREECYQSFPFDGTAAYESRLNELISERRKSDGASGMDELKTLAREVRRITATHGEPDPYLAVLAGDGDRIGPFLGALRDVKSHQAFSSTLNQFARKVRAIVNEHHGVLIYSGGDDVLALLPVDQCVACARALRDAFQQMIDDFLKKHDPVRAVQPTFSVGIAIGHFLEPMEFLLEFARDAEKHAKGSELKKEEQRDALAVHVHPRSGNLIQVRRQWEPPELDDRLQLDAVLQTWTRLFDRNAVPNRAPYELRNVIHAFENWEGDESRNLPAAMQTEVRRILDRKEGRRGRESLAEFRDTIDLLVERLETPGDLRDMATELLVARRIHAASKLAAPVLSDDRQEVSA